MAAYATISTCSDSSCSYPHKLRAGHNSLNNQPSTVAPISYVAARAVILNKLASLLLILPIARGYPITPLLHYHVCTKPYF
jgi:hypothetical protein